MYQLLSHRSPPGMLIIELKKRFDESMVLPALLLGIPIFIILVFLPPLFVFAIFGVAGYVFYASRVRTTLFYDAGTLRIVKKYDLGFTQWQKQTLYDRADVPLPVIWVRVISEKHDSIRLTKRQVRQYQIRFPFAKDRNIGVICVCRDEWQMANLQQEIDDFFTTTRYYKSLHEPSETVASPPMATREPLKKREKKHASDAIREEKRPATRFDETKHYAFDRGETPIRRGDESFNKGESKPNRARLKQTHQKSYKLRHRSIVKVEEWLSTELKHGTLKLVATTGGLFSGIMAAFSMFACRLLILTIVLGGPALIYLHCAQGPEVNRYVVPPLERLVAKFVAEEHREPFDNAIQQYVEINGRQGEKFDVGGVIFFIWCSLIVFFIILMQFVRWPFWGRWTVLIRHTGTYPHEILFSWRNDRSKSKEPIKGFQVFFRVIPATPKTNRILTGRPLFAKNPGWKQPCQVVLITDEGAFPLPCGSVDEQEQILKRINRFTNDMLGLPKAFAGKKRAGEKK